MATVRGALGWDSFRDSSGQLRTGQEVTNSPGPLSPLPCRLLLSLRSAGSSDFFFKACFLSLKGQPLWNLKEWGVPFEGLRRSRGSPGRALGPAGVWTGASDSLPPHAPQDPQKAVCKVGFTEPTLRGPGCRLVPQCGHLPKAGSQAPLAPSPQAGSWPGIGVHECDPRPPAAPAAPGMSPRASAAGGKFVISPEPPVTSLQLGARWGPAAAAYLGMRRALRAR